MTCEVVLMNRRGAAIAADSATTVGDGAKIFHHVQKIFPLADSIPLAVIISGVAEIMGIPWEIVIRSYARELREKRFDTLQQYTEDFLRYIEASKLLFPENVQREWFEQSVEAYWRNQYLVPLSRAKHDTELYRRQPATLDRLLRQDEADWRNCSGAGLLEFSATPVGQILAEYGASIEHLPRRLFGEEAEAPGIRDALLNSVRQMYERPWFHPHDRSWIAFAGMGEAEPFPSVIEHLVGSIACGRLRHAKTRNPKVTRADSAHVVPLAQSDMIDMFFCGIDPDLNGKLDGIVDRAVTGALSGGDTKHSIEIANAKQEFRRHLDREIGLKHTTPLIDAVDCMPLHALAKFAEALVNLTSLRRRACLDQKETVGGTTHVAIVAKAAGFTWAKAACEIPVRSPCNPKMLISA